MDEIRSALTVIENWSNWMPEPLVALFILALAAGIALALHNWARRLTRRLFEERYPYALVIVTKLRGLSRLAVLILAMIIAIPVAPLSPDFGAMLARVLGMAPCTSRPTSTCCVSTSTPPITCSRASTTRRCACCCARSTRWSRYLPSAPR